MPAAEFDLPAGHLDAPALPAVRFPDGGRPEADVLDDVRGRFDEDRFEPDRNFSITYSGHPVARSARRSRRSRAGRFFVEWARETELGTWSMEREAVAMMASLLGGDDRTGGFITTGGTESNLAAMRLARNTGQPGRARDHRAGDDALQLPARRRADGHPAGRDRRRRRDLPAAHRGRRAGDHAADGRPRLLGAGRQLRRARPGRGVRGPRPADGPVPPRRRRVRWLHPAVHARPRLRHPAVRPVAAGRQLDLDRRPQAGPAADRDRLLPGQGRGGPRGDPDRADADPHDVVDEARQPRGGGLGDAPAPRAARAMSPRPRTSSASPTSSPRA